MSKTAEEIGLIVGGLAAALLAGPIGILALQGNVAVFNAMVGIGITSALTGVGLALRPNPSQVGAPNKETFSSSDAPRRVVYGQFQTAGVLTYASFPASQNLSTTNQYLQLVYTLTGHEISSFDAVVIDGTTYNFGTDLIWSPVGDNLWHLYPGSAPGYNDIYWQHMFFEFDYGRPSGGNGFPALSVADSSWTSACEQQGCAKVHVVLRADANWPAVFPAGAIPNIQFLVTGKKLIDPRVLPVWGASAPFVHFRYIIDNNGYIWYASTGGTSGTVRPNFESYSGGGATLTDNTVVWTQTPWSIAGVYAGNTAPPQLNAQAQLSNDGWFAGMVPTANTVIEAPIGYLQLMTTAGTAGSTYPTFSTSVGGTTTDGGITWTCLGRSTHAINPSNSALVVNDYLQNSDWGMNAAPATIDEFSVMAAANVCETQELIIWNSDNTKVYENLYSTNGMFDFSSPRGNVLDSLCQAMAGWVIPPGDMWHVFAGSYQTPTIALGDNDMRGGIKGDFRLSRRDVANSVKGKFIPAFLPVNPAAASSMTLLPAVWQSQSFPAYQANGLAGKPDYLYSEDGGQIIWLDLQLDFCTSLWQAQRLAKIALMRLRFQQTLTLPCKLSAFQLEAGDAFYFTHARWDIGSQVFEVTQWALVLDTQGNDDSPSLGIDLVARQIDPSIYEFTAPTSASDYGEYSPYGITGIMTGVE
jgi:hypothetical protein